MLSEYEIIVFSDEWGRHPFSCQHIMKHFVDSNRMIWVTPTGMRNPKLTIHDINRIIEKLNNWRSSTEECQDNKPLQIKPVALPFNDFIPIRIINNSIVKSKVNNASNSTSKRIVITTLPITAEYIDCFEADAVIYYIVDDFLEMPGINRGYIASLEEKLIAKSDILFASSQKLCEIKSRKRKPILIPHGVDFEHFHNENNALKNNNLLAGMQRPIIGFFGAIWGSPWIDFDLIATAAEAYQGWSFVFIGPVDADINELKKYNNIHFPGKVSYQELPFYAHQFDVGIIPFLVNDLTLSVNPLKLMEYFATGLPVVSTPLPEVKKFKDNLYIANDKSEFIISLKKAVDNLRYGKEERLQIARDHSWRSIAKLFENEIVSFLQKK